MCLCVYLVSRHVLSLSLSVSLCTPRVSPSITKWRAPPDYHKTTTVPLSTARRWLVQAGLLRLGCCEMCVSSRCETRERRQGWGQGWGYHPPAPTPVHQAGGGAGDISANYDAPFASITKRQPIGVSASPHPLPLHTWQCMVGSTPGGWPLAD